MQKYSQLKILSQKTKELRIDVLKARHIIEGKIGKNEIFSRMFFMHLRGIFSLFGQVNVILFTRK